jgi:DNA-binding NarL/FixJ family response regulator
MQPPPEDPRQAEAPVGAQELEILRLMCEGMPDRKIARRLNVGVRTVQRRLADLARRFDAPSRPALAARTVAMGLVSPTVARHARAPVGCEHESSDGSATACRGPQ